MNLLLDEKSIDGLPSLDNTSSAQYGLKRGDAAKQNLTFEVKQPSTTLNKALPENASIIQQCSSVSQLASSSLGTKAAKLQI